MLNGNRGQWKAGGRYVRISKPIAEGGSKNDAVDRWLRRIIQRRCNTTPSFFEAVPSLPLTPCKTTRRLIPKTCRPLENRERRRKGGEPADVSRYAS